jgi:hypothetical protein
MTKKKDQLSTILTLPFSPRKEKSMSPTWMLRRHDRRKRRRSSKQVQQLQEEGEEEMNGRSEEENRFSNDEEHLHSNQDPFASLESLMDQLSQEVNDEGESDENENKNGTVCPSQGRRKGTTNHPNAETYPHHSTKHCGYGEDSVHVQTTGGYIAPSPPDFDVCVHNDNFYDDECDGEEDFHVRYDDSSKNTGKRTKLVDSSLTVSRNERMNSQSHQLSSTKDRSKSHQGRKGGKVTFRRSRGDNNAENVSFPPPPSTTTTVEKVKSIVGLR